MCTGLIATVPVELFKVMGGSTNSHPARCHHDHLAASYIVRNGWYKGGFTCARWGLYHRHAMDAQGVDKRRGGLCDGQAGADNRKIKAHKWCEDWWCV